MKLIGIAALVFALVALRLVHIEADTPSGLSKSAGLYVDEGYKSLSPRNLLLFGATKWNLADEYRGWMTSSPLTQWSYYLAFSLSEVNLASARFITVFYFSFLLLIYVWAMYHRYGTGLFYTGLALLGIEATIYFFSRVALFEVPLSSFLYTLVMAFTRVSDQKRTIAPAVVTLGVGAVIAFTIKLSAILYVLPILAAGLLWFPLNTKVLSSRKPWIYLGAVFVFVTILMAASFDVWSGRIQLSPFRYGYRLIDNPVIAVSPIVVIAGLFCAAHVIVCQWDLYVNNLYRLSLLSLVIMGPLLLAFFQYHPLRYYVPLLPAHLLLVIEWVHTAPWRSSPFQQRNLLQIFVVLLVSIILAAYAMGAAGLRDEVGTKMLALMSVAIGCGMLVLYRIVFSRAGSLVVVAAFGAMFLVQNMSTVGSFLLSPTYDGQRVRERLTTVVKTGQSIAGDWAPFFALSTEIPALYINLKRSSPEYIAKVKPDYFMYSETKASEAALNGLRQFDGVGLGAPIELGRYNNSNVLLYPLGYWSGPAGPSQ